MKAAVINEYGGPEKFEITDIPEPEIEKDDDVLIKVMASSVNPVDWKIRKGNLKLILGSHFPIVLGFDASGEVIKTGKAVTKYKPGDQVYSRLDKKYGRALAEYAIGSENTFALKPEKLSHLEAAAIPLAALTALQALRDKGNIKKGDNVLINGAAGGVGVYAVQLVKHFGARCIAVSSNRHRQIIDEMAPEVFIDYTVEDFKKTEERFDIIFDVVGTESFLTCKHLLNKGGVYITSLPRLKVLLHNMISWLTGRKAKTLLMKPAGKDIEFISKLWEANEMKIYIDKVFTLDQVSEAHAYSQTGRAEGKIVIEVSS